MGSDVNTRVTKGVGSFNTRQAAVMRLFKPNSFKLPQALMLLTVFCLLTSTAPGSPQSGDTGSSAAFFAYHTRLDYTIDLRQAAKAMPGYLEVMKKEGKSLDDLKNLKGKTLTGPHADLVVNLGNTGRFIFSREFGYRPFWQTEKGRWFVDELVPRQKDVACLYCYVRLIEDEPNHVLIHWRYLPDVAEPDGLRGAVHELFRITPDGLLTRTVRQACEKLDDYEDPNNRTIQRLRLTDGGIEMISTRKAFLSRKPADAVRGSPVKAVSVVEPAAWWRFDEGLTSRAYERKDITVEQCSGRDCTIAGNRSLWKRGVSGTALAFDGYFSKVVHSGSHAPAVEDAVSVEAWVALGAYPWNWAPLVHHSLIQPGPYSKTRQADKVKRDGIGYYLGIDAYGYPVFMVNGRQVKAAEKLELYRWTHVAATYGDGFLRIYVDGRQAGAAQASGTVRLPDTDLLIGLNNRQGRATDPVRGPRNHLPTIYGIEGLVDEVKIYTVALTPKQILESYEYLKPSSVLRKVPDLAVRVLPGRTGPSGSFGASYTRLQYHELWDNMWRTSPYPDVVVKFDKMPTSVVYWRGANLGAGWVTENNKWMEDQSTETGGPHGCAEHMADKDCRHCYIRVIENTDARVVLHWRYSSADVGYVFTHPLHWTDEYHTIYPDGTGVRRVHYRRGSESWQDVQFFSEPGTTCLDNVHLQALSVADLSGRTLDLTWQSPRGVPKNTLTEACIEQVNFKSKYKVFLIFQEFPRINPWGADEQSPYTEDPFAGPWNHWPVSLLPSDGRFAVAADRLTHAALGAARRTPGNMAVYGFNDGPISALVPLARMWNHPPALTDVEGAKSEGYDKAQRAYVLVAGDSRIRFRVEASEESPVVNPCIVIKNWGSRTAKAAVKTNGSLRQTGPAVRQGIVTDTDGSPSLVIWLEEHRTRPASYEITRM